MSRHISDGDLASYVGDDLKPRKAAKVGTHLAGCAICGERAHQLESMPNLLSSVHFPAIPRNLSSRVEMAIAGESAARVASQPASEAGRRDLPARAGPGRSRPGRSGPGGARPGRPGWRLPGLSSPLALRTLAAVGAAVIVAGGGYELATHGASSSSSGPENESIHPPTQGAAAGEVQLGQRISYRHGDHTRSVVVVRSGSDFQPATLQKQADDAIAAERSSAASPGIAAGKNAPLLSEPANNGSFGAVAPMPNLGLLRGCVGRISAGRDVLLVDVAKYLGKRATIIVVSEPHGLREVFAVTPSCSASVSDILAHQDLLRP